MYQMEKNINRLVLQCKDPISLVLPKIWLALWFQEVIVCMFFCVHVPSLILTFTKTMEAQVQPWRKIVYFSFLFIIIIITRKKHIPFPAH